MDFALQWRREFECACNRIMITVEESAFVASEVFVQHLDRSFRYKIITDHQKVNLRFVAVLILGDTSESVNGGNVKRVSGIEIEINHQLQYRTNSLIIFSTGSFGNSFAST